MITSIKLNHELSQVTSGLQLYLMLVHLWFQITKVKTWTAYFTGFLFSRILSFIEHSQSKESFSLLHQITLSLTRQSAKVYAFWTWNTLCVRKLAASVVIYIRSAQYWACLHFGTYGTGAMRFLPFSLVVYPWESFPCSNKKLTLKLCNKL